jgi:hypothetical protein
VSDCSWKPLKLLLPPLEGASIVNGDPLMSNASASNGAGTCGGVGEQHLCLKKGRFPEPDASAGAMLEQLPPTLTATAGAGDDAPDAGDMVEGLAGVAMRNA